MILGQMPQVRLIAQRLYGGLAGDHCLEDLVSIGTLGLIAAVDNYQESRCVKLKTYAEHKIRGAILDSLRSSDWVSRGCRTRAKEMKGAVRSLEQRLQRNPTLEEVAADRSLSIDQCHARLAEAHTLQLMRLDAPAGGAGNETLGSLIPDDAAKLPSAALERSERERWLRDAIDAMPDMDRTVMVLSYFEELTGGEVAAMIGIDIAQVTRLKWHSILRLRVRMGKQLHTGARRRHRRD